LSDPFHDFFLIIPEGLEEPVDDEEHISVGVVLSHTDLRFQECIQIRCDIAGNEVGFQGFIELDFFHTSVSQIKKIIFIDTSFSASLLPEELFDIDSGLEFQEHFEAEVDFFEQEGKVKLELTRKVGVKNVEFKFFRVKESLVFLLE